MSTVERCKVPEFIHQLNKYNNLKRIVVFNDIKVMVIEEMAETIKNEDTLLKIIRKNIGNISAAGMYRIQYDDVYGLLRYSQKQKMLFIFGLYSLGVDIHDYLFDWFKKHMYFRIYENEFRILMDSELDVAYTAEYDAKYDKHPVFTAHILEITELYEMRKSVIFV